MKTVLFQGDLCGVFWPVNRAAGVGGWRARGGLLNPPVDGNTRELVHQPRTTKVPVSDPDAYEVLPTPGLSAHPIFRPRPTETDSQAGKSGSELKEPVVTLTPFYGWCCRG